MELPSSYRMLLTGGMMGAASAFRASLGCLELVAQRAPTLARLSASSEEPEGPDAAARAHFRDELIALARDSSQLALREIRRGVEDLDAFTRPPEEADGGSGQRRYRAKP